MLQRIVNASRQVFTKERYNVGSIGEEDLAYIRSLMNDLKMSDMKIEPDFSDGYDRRVFILFVYYPSYLQSIGRKLGNK